MHNPVDWHPWGEAALAKARAEDKPLLVSIGYSACHWCHVMERESFEDADTAALLNQLFVPVKVDREERPDVDRIYMDFVVRTSGHGGWPLTVFCTPDGRPFWGGTYFPPVARHGLPSFRDVLSGLGRAWATQRADVEASATQVVAQLARRPAGVATAPPGAHSLRDAATGLLEGADSESGGFGGAPKFPTPTTLEALLAAIDVLPAATAQAALDHLLLSCREMARRGLFDQLGGGFHRYCVDATWTIPHFEKMLYDEGQLLRVYAETWRRSAASLGASQAGPQKDADDELIWPIRETVAYLRREMAAADGGFFASQDADSEGHEGIYYVWTPEQIRSELGDERGAAFCAHYGVTKAGNFEHGTTQLVDEARHERARFAAERAQLLTVRARRIAPATDRKRVASWNAWLISGLARAGSLLGDAAMLDDAVATADFVLTQMRDAGGRLTHVYNEGRAHGTGFLEDVAAMLEATLDLHRALSGSGGLRGGDRFLDAAVLLAEDIVARFFDETDGDLYLTPNDGERLVHRPRSEPDGATPNAAGAAALGLLRAAALTGRSEWHEIVLRVLRANAYGIERAPGAFPTFARAAAIAERGLSVAIVIGATTDPATAALADRARRVLTPEDGVIVVAPGAAPSASLDPAWLLGREAVGGHPTAYVCRGTTCSLPVQEAAALTAL